MNLSLKFHLNRVSNRWHITDIEFVWGGGGVCKVILLSNPTLCWNIFEITMQFIKMLQSGVGSMQGKNTGNMPSAVRGVKKNKNVESYLALTAFPFHYPMGNSPRWTTCAIILEWGQGTCSLTKHTRHWAYSRYFFPACGIFSSPFTFSIVWQRNTLTSVGGYSIFWCSGRLNDKNWPLYKKPL